ncbi:MAG: Ig-like domain-containing protein [Pseudomonadales bacterium]|nr:Ig-like domain-containing protein [Pseudomonadales bacterium]
MTSAVSATASQFQTVLRTLSLQASSEGSRTLLVRLTDTDGLQNDITYSNTARLSAKVIRGQVVSIPFSSKPAGLNNSSGSFVGEFTYADPVLGNIAFKATDDSASVAFESLSLSFNASDYGLIYSESDGELHLGIKSDFTSARELAFKAPSRFVLLGFDAIDRNFTTFDRYTVTGFLGGVQQFQESIVGSNSSKLTYSPSAANAATEIDELRINPSFNGESVTGADFYIDNISLLVPSSSDSDGNLTAGAGVTEPVSLDTTADTILESVDIFDFTLSDGGTSDGLPMAVSQVVVNVSGTSTDTERAKITWRLNGPDASNVTGTYSAAADTITFPGLSISVADGASETYTINAYYNDNRGLTEDNTIILSVDGDTDLTVESSGTQMGGTSSVHNGTGTAIDVVATQLAFVTQPAGSTSGSVLSTQPVVAARDAFGNTDVDFSETITLTESSAGALSNSAASSVSGVATFTGVIYTATSDQESFTLIANDQDSVGSDLVPVNANAVTSDVVATKLLFDTQPSPASVTSGSSTAFTTVPVIRAVDASDITDTGYSTNIMIAEINGAGSATMTGTGDLDGDGSTVTLAPGVGVATFTGLQITYTASGASNENFNLQASSGGLSSATSTQLTASVTPTITSVSVPANATYVAGQNLDVTVNTSGAITVNTAGGTPRIVLDIGGSAAYANYLSGSGTNSLAFRYTLQSGDLDTDGIGIATLDTNGGTLQNSSGNDLDTTLNAVGSTAAILVDAVNPTVSSVTVPSAGRYVAGNNLDFTLNVSENLTLNTGGGVPRIALTLGSTTRYASYISGSGTASLVFRYVVQSGDEDTDGVTVAAAVDSNGGTLKDAAGNDLVTTLNAVGDTSAILVDTVAPAGHSVNFDDSTLNAAEAASASFTFIAAEVGTDYSYTISSTGGGTPVTGSGTVATASDQITGVDLSGLADGTLTLSVTLTDAAGNSAVAVTDTATLDVTAPSGHSVSFDDNVFNVSEAAAASFSFAGGEVGATYGYSVSSSGGGVPVTGSGTLATASDQVAGLDLTGLADGTLTLVVTVTDTAGNAASAVTDTSTLDAAAPSGHGVGFDDSLISSAEASSVSFTFLGAEAGADYSYTISSSGGGVPVTGAGTLASATDQVANLDLGGLSDGTLTLSVTLTDGAGNVASAVSDTAALDTASPAGHSVSFDDATLSGAEVSSVSFTLLTAETGTDYSYTISSNGGGTPVTGSGTVATASDQITGVDLSGLADGTLTLSVTLTDTAGNSAVAVTDTATLDGTAATVTLSTAAPAVTNAAFEVAIVFSEAVDGFVVGDVTAVNAALSGFTGSGANYSVTVTPSNDGVVTVDVASGVAQDAAGNTNVAATQLSRVFDGTAPAPVISTDANALTNGPINLTINFGEVVSGFVSGDLSVTNGNVTAFTDQGGGVFDLTVEAAADGNVVLSLPAAVADDEAGNASIAATPLTIAFDGSGPTLQSSSPSAGASAVSYQSGLTLTFDEPVFAVSGDLVLQDATDGVEHTRIAINGAGVVIVGAQVEVTLEKTLVPTHDYYVTVASGSLEDEAGNAWGGIQNDTTLSFTVGNEAPQANNDTATISQDQSVAIDLLANDTDLEGDLSPASVRMTTAPFHGQVTINTGTGVAIYTPEPGFNGSDSFAYVVEDQYRGQSAAATVAVNVVAEVRAPVARADVANGVPGDIVVLDLVANDSPGIGGVSLDNVTLTLINRPLNGTAEIANGELTYVPEEGFGGIEQLRYSLTDPDGRVSNVADVWINLSDSNQPPVTLDDSAETPAGTTLTLDILANDSDSEGALDPSSVSLMSLPAHGSVNLDEVTGRLTYAPDAGFRGEDRLTYVVRDAEGLVSPVAEVILAVGTNEAPVARDDQVRLVGDKVHAISVLGNDGNGSASLVSSSLRVVNTPLQGSVTVDAALGLLLYTPDAGFTGTDELTYTVEDDQGRVSAPAIVRIGSGIVNNVPVANPDRFVLEEDSSLTLDLLTNDQDLEAGLSRFDIVLIDTPRHGSVSVESDGTLIYSPDQHVFGEDRLTYRVADAQGGESRVVSARLRITPKADVPLISGTPTRTVTAEEAYRFTPVVKDIDGNPLQFSILNKPIWATFDDTTGRLSGTPGVAQVGVTEGIVISVSNGDESASLPAFDLLVADNSGGDQATGGGVTSPPGPGAEEDSPVYRVNPDDPQLSLPESSWPATEGEPPHSVYRVSFIDANGDGRTISVTQGANVAPPLSSGPNANGELGLEFSQADGSRQTVSIGPDGEAELLVFRQAGDASPVSRLTSRAPQLDSEVREDGRVISGTVIERTAGGFAKVDITQSPNAGVTVAMTIVAVDGTESDPTLFQFDLVPADVDLSADGVVTLQGQTVNGAGDAVVVSVRLDTRGGMTVLSSVDDGVSDISSGIVTESPGAIGGLDAAGNVLVTPSLNAPANLAVTVDNLGTLEFDENGTTVTEPNGGKVVLDASGVSQVTLNDDPDGNGLRRAAEVSRPGAGLQSLARLEVTDVESGNAGVFVENAADGDGFAVQRNLGDRTLTSQIRLDGSAQHRLAVDGQPANEVIALLPQTLSIFFDDRAVTVADQNDATLYVEALLSGEMRHEVVRAGNSTRAISRLPGSRTQMEQGENGAQVITEGASEGRQITVIAREDGSARHQLVNRLGHRTRAGIAIPGTATDIAEDGGLISRVRLGSSDLCAWVETFGNGETSTGFGRYDAAQGSCVDITSPTNLDSAFESGNAVSVEESDGHYSITVEADVTRPIRF